MAMKFKVGDQVRFLNDIGGGIVNRIDVSGLVYVVTGDGFEIPVAQNELVPLKNFNFSEREEKVEKPQSFTPDVKSKSEKEKPLILPQLPGNIPAEADIHLILGFIPESAGPVFSSSMACYLINDSPYFTYYLAGRKESGSLIYLTSGYIEADTKAHIGSFDQTTLSKTSDIHIQLIFISRGRYIRRSPVDKMISLNLVNFSKESYFRTNEYFEEKAVLFSLSDKGMESYTGQISVPDDVRELKILADSGQETKQKKKEPVQDTLEVDLHFDGEVMQNSQLTPGAILALQMSRFHSAVEEAISKNLRRLVVIHGLGQGTLKMQIRKELQEKYPGFIYQDASFKEYGFGATMVHLIIDQKQ